MVVKFLAESGTPPVCDCSLNAGLCLVGLLIQPITNKDLLPWRRVEANQKNAVEFWAIESRGNSLSTAQSSSPQRHF
jgi:hypothetical protein